jgi:hypothetical protein
VPTRTSTPFTTRRIPHREVVEATRTVDGNRGSRSFRQPRATRHDFSAPNSPGSRRPARAASGVGRGDRHDRLAVREVPRPQRCQLFVQALALLPMMSKGSPYSLSGAIRREASRGRRRSCTPVSRHGGRRSCGQARGPATRTERFPVVPALCAGACTPGRPRPHAAERGKIKTDVLVGAEVD